MPVAEEAVVTDALKRIRENMQQEAPQKLVCRQSHHLMPLLVFVVLVGEGDLSVVECLQPVVGDGDTMGIAVCQTAFSDRAGRTLARWRGGLEPRPPSGP